jgi:hypothetical protein
MEPRAFLQVDTGRDPFRDTFLMDMKPPWDKPYPNEHA